MTEELLHGELHIEYVPDAVRLDVDSLRKYLLGFRDRKETSELVVAEIADTLDEALRPHHLKVTGSFRQSGIVVTVTAVREDELEDADEGGNWYRAEEDD